MTLDRKTALADLEHLADLVGVQLEDIPVDALDQWGMQVRDAFTRLDAVPLNPAVSRAAFAGGYIVASMLVNSTVGGIQAESLQTVSNLLRWLYERGNPVDGDDVTDWDAWLQMG